jgi:hypothetical protein
VYSAIACLLLSVPSAVESLSRQHSIRQPQLNTECILQHVANELKVEEDKAKKDEQEDKGPSLNEAAEALKERDGMNPYQVFHLRHYDAFNLIREQTMYYHELDNACKKSARESKARWLRLEEKMKKPPPLQDIALQADYQDARVRCHTPIASVLHARDHGLGNQVPEAPHATDPCSHACILVATNTLEALPQRDSPLCYKDVT